MSSDKKELGSMILGMREASLRGESTMAWARERTLSKENLLISTLVAYDLRAGSYAAYAKENPEYVENWSLQLSELIKPYVDTGDCVLEVGVGEATTLAGVIKALKRNDLFFWI